MTNELESVYYNSSVETQKQIFFADGSPCNEPSATSASVETKVIAVGAKKDYYISEEVDKIAASPYYDRAADLIQIFENSVVNFSLPTDSNLLDDTLLVNQVIFESLKNDKDFDILYPSLAERINQDTLFTPVEIAELKLDYFITDLPYYVSSQGISSLCRSMDLYYTDGSSYSRKSMQFCALIQGVFDKVKKYFDIGQDIGDFIKEVQGFIEDLKNLSFKSVIDTFVKNATNTINDIVKRYTRQLENLTKFFSDATEIPSAVSNKYKRLKTDAETFLKEHETLSERIKGVLGYILSIFEDKTAEDIQFMIYRLCSLLSQVENIFSDVFKPITDLKNNFDHASSVFKNRQSYNTAFAVAAGAMRYSVDDIPPQVSTGRRIVREQGGAAADWVPPRNTEIDGIPKWEDIRQGTNRDNRIVLSGSLSGPKYAPGVNMSSEGWNRVKVEAITALLRLQKYFSDATGRNVKFTINSAYRSPEYNARLNGSAKKSLHMQGMAFDIAVTWPSSQTDLFIRCAKEAGFRGFGFYPKSNFIHVDIGPRRTWNG